MLPRPSGPVSLDGHTPNLADVECDPEAEYRRAYVEVAAMHKEPLVQKGRASTLQALVTALRCW